MSTEGTLTDDTFPPAALEDWRQRVSARLEGGDLASLRSMTPDGVALEPLYTESVSSVAAVERGGPGGGSGACALLDAADPLEARSSLRRSLTCGADGVYLRLDRSTRLGLDLEDEATLEHLGAGGMVLRDRAELAIAFDQVDLSGLAIWLEAGGNALPATAVILAELERRGGTVASVALHCGADPLAALALDGVLPRDLMKLESEMAVLARFSNRRLPMGRAITVSTLPYQEAGAGMSAELAYAAATTVTYLRGLGDSGLGAAEAASEICWRFGLGTDVFSEIAKLRAARVLWRMVLVACGVEAPPPARIHGVSSLRSLSRRASMNNGLRATGQMFSACCGGADAVTLRTSVPGQAPADGDADRLAVTTQAILREEAHLGRVVDPGAGSHYVETLTGELARAAWAEAQEVERLGGMRECLLSGRVAEAVELSAGRRRRSFESGEAGITGVTRFVAEDEAPGTPVLLDAVALRAAILARRPGGRVATEADSGGVSYSRDFVIERLVAAAGRGATVAALADELGDAAGAESCQPLVPRRDAAPFESDGSGAPER